MAQSIARALAKEDQAFAATRWSDALSSGGQKGGWGGRRYGTRLIDSRRTHLRVSPAEAFAPIRRIGGARGWYAMNWAWRLRGFLDLLVGGVGLRRGRRDPERLVPGDTLDFWRVEAVEPDRLLRLQAEMRLPGRAWLQFEVEPAVDGCVVRQTAVFDPAGLFGRAYWTLLWPLHALVFRGMLRGVARRARDGARLRLRKSREGPRGSEDKPGKEGRRRCTDGEVLLGGPTQPGAAAAPRIQALSQTEPRRPMGPAPTRSPGSTDRPAA